MRAVLLVAAGALLMTTSLPATAPEAPPSSLAQALARWPDGAPQADHVVVPETIGFGAASQPNFGWPFCDAVGVFAYGYGPIEVHHGLALRCR